MIYIYITVEIKLHIEVLSFVLTIYLVIKSYIYNFLG